MMSDREVWLKAMAIVEARGAIEGAQIVDIILDVVGGTPYDYDWMRVAASVDAINAGQLQ